ncbi:MAG: hypothetical protein ACRD0N_01375 [Acidimicrobiales bacterium]
MRTPAHRRLRRAAVIALAGSALLLAGPAGPALAAPKVTAVNGSALGYWADNISLFGGAQPDTGPTPSVTLASNASNSPQAASTTTGLVQYGPATLFSSDGISVNSSGATGPSGFATSSTSITNVNKAATQPNTGSEIFTADGVASTCSATISGLTRSTSITNGTLQTDSGWDDGDLVYPEPAAAAGGTDEHDPVVVTIPSSPAPNTTYTGHIHLSGTSVDSWQAVFNEHVTNGNGSSTVNALHEYFIGPILLGHMSLGRSTCGVTARG